MKLSSDSNGLSFSLPQDWCYSFGARLYTSPSNLICRNLGKTWLYLNWKTALKLIISWPFSLMPWLSQLSIGALCPSLTQTLAAGQEQRQELQQILPLHTNTITLNAELQTKQTILFHNIFCFCKAWSQSFLFKKSLTTIVWEQRLLLCSRYPD